MLRRFFLWLAGEKHKRKYVKSGKYKKAKLVYKPEFKAIEPNRKPRAPYGKMTDEKLRQGKNLLLSGASGILIAKQLKVAQSTIYKNMEAIKAARPLFEVKEKNILPQTGGNQIVWDHLNSLQKIRSAAVSQADVYSALMDERSMAAVEVNKALGLSDREFGSTQAALSYMARTGIVIRTNGVSPDTGRVCYVYRRHKNNEHVSIRSEPERTRVLR